MYVVIKVKLSFDHKRNKKSAVLPIVHGIKLCVGVMCLKTV